MEKVAENFSYQLPVPQWNHCPVEDIALDKSRTLTTESPCTVSAAKNKRSLNISWHKTAMTESYAAKQNGRNAIKALVSIMRSRNSLHQASAT